VEVNGYKMEPFVDLAATKLVRANLAGAKLTDVIGYGTP
jgi:hypothetical protein